MKNIKTALIFGVSGQDGSYLAQNLLEKGYILFGITRDVVNSSLSNLKLLGIESQIKLISMPLSDFESILVALRGCNPDEVYFLAGQTSVGLSFERPTETFQSIAITTMNILEAIRITDPKIKFFNSGSSECFGNVGLTSSDENTPFQPSSPYAISKASAHWMVVNYRKIYGLFACNGILFNHESPLRPARFVTKKIISAACRISEGSTEKLELGAIDIVRDWGWAPEYVDAMWLMLQQSTPKDYVIATGEANSLEDFVRFTFESLGLDWRKHVILTREMLRPTDLYWSQGNPTKAKSELGWCAKINMKDVIRNMISAELRKVT